MLGKSSSFGVKFLQLHLVSRITNYSFWFNLIILLRNKQYRFLKIGFSEKQLNLMRIWEMKFSEIKIIISKTELNNLSNNPAIQKTKLRSIVLRSFHCHPHIQRL